MFEGREESLGGIKEGVSNRDEAGGRLAEENGLFPRSDYSRYES